MPRVLAAVLLLGIAPALAVADEPRIVGHRGLIRHAPEQTMADFDACFDLRLSLELDVRKTRDGQLVVIHEATLERTTDGKGTVADMSLREIQRLDAGSKFDPAFAGERVPTLEEVFARMKERKAAGILIAVDLKTPEIETDVVKLAEKYGVLRQLVFIGLAIENPSVRAKLRNANPDAACAALCPAADKLDAAIADASASWVYLRFIPTADEVKRVHAVGKKVFLVGPLVAGKEPANWATGRDGGVDAILTDYPLECRAAWRTGKMP
jgi:glycerophosphoryl diester phosphodiesterase